MMTDDERQASPLRDLKPRPIVQGRSVGGRIVEGRRIAAGAPSVDDFTYSIVEAPARPVAARQKAALVPTRGGKTDERRGEDRQRTRLRDGILAEGQGRIVGDCRIRDRSKRGARLQLASDKALPKLFLLVDPASRTRFRAMLIWQEGRDAGVKLTAVD